MGESRRRELDSGGGSSPAKKNRTQPSLADVFALQLETNLSIKEMRDEFKPRLEAVETRQCDLEERVAKVERTLEQQAERGSTPSPSPSREQPGKAQQIIVVGSDGPEKVRPNVSEVAKLLSRPESDIKVTFPGSTVVEVLWEGQLEVLRHRLVGSGFWANVKTPPAERKAQKELRLIIDWFGNQSEVVGTAQWSSKQIVDSAGKPLVGLADKRDRVVWHCHKLRLKWLARG